MIYILGIYYLIFIRFLMLKLYFRNIIIRNDKFKYIYVLYIYN